MWVVAVPFIAAQPAKCEEIKELKNLHYSYSTPTYNGSVIYDLTGNLKPASVTAISIILVAKVTMQATLFAAYLNKHDAKEEKPDGDSLPCQ